MSSLRANKGFQPTIEQDHEYVFVDSCMQAWPDAEWETANRLGVTALGVTAWDPGADLDEALEGLMYWHLVARRHDNVVTVETADDIRQAKADDEVALLLASQDGTFIGDNLHRIEAFHRLGLRTLIPTYNRANNICAGCLEATDAGLTRFGRKVVEECNRLGLVLDCSHLGYRSSLDIIEESDDPVVFSHSNVRHLADNPRNIVDDQIEACAEAGGVIGLAPFGPFIKRADQDEWPSLDDFLDHVDHVADLTGSTDHIGIGTDLSLGTYPDHEHDPWGEPDYPDVSKDYNEAVTGNVRSPKRMLRDFHMYPHVTNLIEKLHERGYDDRDVEKILGGNYLRVYDEVWA